MLFLILEVPDIRKGLLEYLKDVYNFIDMMVVIFF
jgi:hypothetical protein